MLENTSCYLGVVQPQVVLLSKSHLVPGVELNLVQIRVANQREVVPPLLRLVFYD